DGGSTDDLEIEVMTIEPANFTCSDIGTVEVILSVRDSGGNISSCSTSISVIDLQVPKISSVEAITVDNTAGICGANINIEPPLVIDNCGSWNAYGTRSDGFELSEPLNIGKTTITWRTSATEPVSEAVEQIIIVVDAEAPTITPAGTVIVENTPGHCSATVVIEPPLVIDN